MEDRTGRSESGSEQPRRRRRADARRNVADILAAAERVLAQHPEAGMAEIARAAGVTRQTVYAHFRSRDALLNALLEQLTQRVTAALDAADLESGPATQAVVRFLEAAWQASFAEPLLLQLAQQPQPPEPDSDLHQPMAARLRSLVQRGQDGGEFDPEQPADWLVSTAIALAHAAGEEVRAGRMSTDEALDALRRTAPRALAP